MSLKNWNELSPLVKRNPQKFFNYLAEELGLETSWDDLTVIERRSRHKQYKLIQETVTDLPDWNELSPFERRNIKKLYKKIQKVAGEEAAEPDQPTKYSLSVTVTDSEETAIPGATVTLTDSTDNSITFSGTSGSKGGCTIKPVAGTYIVTAICEGYEDYASVEDLVVSENANLSIMLSLAKPQPEIVDDQPIN